ncbi:acylneuraminate cytidylyltransferase family protein [Rhabdobacter roseus]|uniref:N-acylneuraminate cytidylyltransferase n=1 Tax=Rhabdobacter roseus TaxID=1655419 RepID=A0A840TYL3_9BACT|nr:acylneuraminate cytidylyltransferase family protein [Rhabdobacter roseus]MBB5284980.1 N-acylneuraminate cytidylyltransferase [Rhabdobacter roseus]
MKEILAIVPARGGSKGLPDKNILPLAGHPLIGYSIRAGLVTPAITRVIVSTDSERIAAISRSYGAEVPFLRPAELAQDHSTDLEVFVHALHWLRQHENYHPDLVVQLRPTSPIRFVQDLEACIQRMLTSEADSLRVVTPAPVTPYKMWTVADESTPMQPLLTLDGVPEPYNQPRQQLPTIYWQIGTLDVIRPAVILEQNSMSGSTILPHIVSQDFAVDIDDYSSFLRAESIIKVHDCIKF